jgi:outer membrane protein
MTARFAKILFTILALSGAAGAYADEDRLNNSARIGAYYVTYDTQADDIRGPLVPPGANVRLQDLVTPYFGFVRTLSDHFSVELAFGVPPLTKSKGKGPAKLGSVPFAGETIVTARWLSPTVLLEYSFRDESARLRPYIGAGINYTRFYSRQSTAAGNAVAGGPTAVGLTTSVGPAVTAGLSFRVTRHFYVYGSISAAEVDSDLTTNTAGVVRKTHISFGPRTLVLSAGYSF